MRAREQIRSLKRDGTVAVATAMIAGALLVPANVRAFNGNAAANYADQYALGNNTKDYPIWDNDCANYTSQVMRAGGYPWHNMGGSTTDNHNWWFKWTWGGISWNNTRSWSFAADQRSFLILDIPGGIIKGQTTGNSNTGSNYWRRWPTNVGLTRGDLLYYDWGQGAGWSHVSVLTVQGGYSTGYGWYGDLVDAHNNKRYRAFWDLSEYNAYAWTTKVEAMHIAASN